MEGRRNVAPVKFNVKGAFGRSQFFALESNDQEINSNNGVVIVEDIDVVENIEDSISIFQKRNGQNQMKRDNINSTVDVHAVKEVGGINDSSVNDLNDTGRWLNMIEEHNKEVGQEKITVIIGSGVGDNNRRFEKRKQII